MKLVVPTPVWYGMRLAAPFARLVAAFTVNEPVERLPRTPALLYSKYPEVPEFTAVVPTVTKAPPDGPAGPCGPVAPIEANTCQYVAFGGGTLMLVVSAI